jgi:hypothetical protein
VGRCPNIKSGAGFGPGASSFGGPGSKGQLHALQTCVNDLGVHQEVVFQPISRYWVFQWSELGIFLAAAVLLAGFCFWWVRRRLT